MTVSDVGDAISDTLYKQVGKTNGRFQKHREPPIDILENTDSYLVVFDAPGVEPADVQVRYIEHTVTVRLERYRKFREGYKMRFPGRAMTLQGSATLPADTVVDPDSATARLTTTGELCVEIPKVDSSDDTSADVESVPLEE